MKEYFSISEAAEFLHVTTRTLKNWRKSGRLKPVKTSENGYGYYSYDQLVKIPKLVKSNTQTSESSEIQSSENFQTSERGEIITSEKTSESSESSENLTSETSEIFLQTSENQTSEIIQTSEISPLQTSESSETGESQTSENLQSSETGETSEKYKTAHKEAATISEIDNTTYYAECQQHITHPACVKYLQGRGLPIDFCREHGVGFDIANYLVVIPHTKSFCTRRYIGDNPNRPRFSYQKGSHLDLFNVEALANNPIVAVTESAFDALTLMYLGIPTVGLGGTSNWEKFANSVKVQLNLPIVLLALDNDEAGQKTSNDIEEELSSVGIFSYDISKMLCGTFKDPNERLQRDSDGLNKSVEHIKSEKYTEYLESLKENFDILQEAKIKKWEQVMSLFNLPNTDDDNAKRILKLYDNDIRFLFDLDRWLMFKSPVWSIAPNTKNSVLYPLVRKLSDTMIEYAKNDEQLKQGNMLQSRKRRSDAIEMIKGYDRIIITSKDLNNHPMLLNCANGVIDLETGRLMDRDKSLLFTLCTGAKYHAGYHSEAIDTFLKQIIPDEATLEALLLYLGYCLTASTRE